MGSQQSAQACVNNAIVKSLPGTEKPNNGTTRGRWKRQNATPSEHAQFLSRERQIYVWLSHSGMFSHHALIFNYFTTLDGSEEIVQRFLKVEILCDDTEVFLRYTGPGKINSDALDAKPYTKNLQKQLKCSIEQLKQKCDEVFDTFGDYHETRNNCQTFVYGLGEALARCYGDTDSQSEGSWLSPPGTMNAAEMSAVMEACARFAVAPPTKRTGVKLDGFGNKVHYEEWKYNVPAAAVAAAAAVQAATTKAEAEAAMAAALEQDTFAAMAAALEQDTVPEE